MCIIIVPTVYINSNSIKKWKAQIKLRAVQTNAMRIVRDIEVVTKSTSSSILCAVHLVSEIEWIHTSMFNFAAVKSVPASSAVARKSSSWFCSVTDCKFCRRPHSYPSSNSLVCSWKYVWLVVINIALISTNCIVSQNDNYLTFDHVCIKNAPEQSQCKLINPPPYNNIYTTGI